MAVNLSGLTRPVGPLPLWAWGALAGGGVLLFLARRGVPAAAAAVDPNVPVPAAPTDPGAAAPPPQPVTTLNPGQTVYDPNTQTQTTPVTVSDLIGGGNLSDFIGKLGPNYQDFQFHSGDTGLSVQHAAQNVLDEQSQEANMAAQVAEYASQQQAYTAATHDWLSYLLGAKQSDNATYLAQYQASLIGQHAAANQYTYGASH